VWINCLAKAVKGEKMFAVKRSVLEELFKDPKWTEQLEKAKNFGEVERVLRLFVEAKKLRIKEM